MKENWKVRTENFRKLDFSIEKIFLKMSKKKIFGIAGSVLILILALMFWYANANYNNAELALKYYKEPDPKVMIKEDNSELFKVTADAFYRKNYARAIDMGLNVPPEMKNRWDAQLLVAHGFLKTSQIPEALEVFTFIIEKGDGRWDENAAYHRLLTHVQAGNDSQIEHYSNEILQNDSGAFVPDVKALNRDLDSFWRKLVFKVTIK